MTDYYYQRGLRKIARTPQEVRATPSKEDLTLAHVAKKSKKKG